MSNLHDYEIKGEIGSGAYGAVYRAWQPAVGRQVAIKVIRPEHASEPAFVERFEAEARMVARLEHPYIVPVYDYWRDDSGAYLVMRLLGGGSLKDRLRDGHLGVEDVVKLAGEICDALAAAHDQGVIHRDLKPANILFDERDNAYLTDFGIAKNLEAEVKLTQTGAILGTPDYISPEQIKAEPLTPAADQYSLGIVLFEALTGRVPFPNLSIAALFQKHLTEPIPLLATLNPGIPGELDSVLRRATAKEPAERYAEIIELAEALRGAVSTTFPETLSRFDREERAPDDKPLVLKLLGLPEATWNGEPMALQRRQARALLYRLATELQPVTRDALLLLLWPDSAENTARRNLTRLLSYLRKALPDPDILQTTRAGVLLNRDLAVSDVDAFSRHLAVNDEPSWEAAVSLVRGPFLEGFSLPGSYEFDSWQSSTGQQIERQYLTALSELASAKTDAADYPAAILYARQYLDTDDLAEEIHRQLISLYAANGQRSAALRQFEQCVLVLERELGVEPLPETRAAYEAARDGAQLQPTATTPQIEWTTLPGLQLPLIGRDRVWEELAQAYDRLRGGGVILISGEPGVGKSRLMQEFATAQSGLVLTGNSHADGQTLPYQPLVQALRQAMPLHERWRHAAPIWLAETSRLLPELPSHFPNLPQPAEVEAQQAQARLFEALTQLFHSLSTDSPVLLCLDDVHWADEATRGWLQYMTKELAGSDLCFLATFRTHEKERLTEWERALQRDDLETVVQLDGLSERAVAALLQQAGSNLAAPARVVDPETLAPRIHAATGGNAFFVLETVRELLEIGQLADPPADLPLPSTVRDAVLRRAGRLTPLAQQILEITSVLSPLSTFEVICSAAGRDELRAADSLEELLARQLLLADGDRFHFQHELAREAIHQNISVWRRRLLHRRAANALAELSQREKADLAAIAFHFEAAGDSDKAIDYYRQAAATASVLYAHQEAIGHLNRAIALGVEDSEAATTLPQLYEALGDNLGITGEFAAAEEAYRKVLAQGPEGDPLQLAELERKLAATLPPQQRANEAVSIYRASLGRLDEPPPAAAARKWQSARLSILFGLLDARYFQFQPEAMAELREQTQALLEQVGTAEQQAGFYARLNQIAFLQNRFRVPAENIPLAREALASAQESGNARLIARQQFHLGFQELWHGDLDDAEEMLGPALATAKELGDFWLQDQCLAYLTVLYRFQGNVAEAASCLSPLLEVSQKVGNKMYIGASQANSAWLHYRAGEWQQAQAQAELALVSWADTEYPFQWLANWLLLALAVQQDRLPDAISAIRAMLDPEQQQPPDEVADLLAAALAAWDMSDETAVRALLKNSVELAQGHGYL